MTLRIQTFGIATTLTLALVGSGEAANAMTIAPDYSSFEASSVVTKGGISARITAGLAQGKNGSAGGAFSDFSNLAGLVEVNFNDAVGGQKTFTSGGLEFAAQNTFGSSGGKTGIINGASDNWAPANPDGTKNTSKYLGVFQNNSVTVKLGQTMSYFGINWGALSSENRFTLKRGDVQVATFTYKDINAVAPTYAKHQNERNGYLHLYADSNEALFDTLVLEQTGGGGFEVDNFSYVASSTKFDYKESVPEPGMMLGLMAVGGVAALSRRLGQAEQEA